MIIDHEAIEAKRKENERVRKWSIARTIEGIKKLCARRKARWHPIKSRFDDRLVFARQYKRAFRGINGRKSWNQIKLPTAPHKNDGGIISQKHLDSFFNR